MYKSRNTGTGNGKRGIRGMFYSGECRQTFRVMSSNIPGNVAKHSREYCQTFRVMSSNILGNVAKHSGECRQVFRGISPNIPGNDAKYSGECRKIFRGMSPNILDNIIQEPRNNHNGLAFKFNGRAPKHGTHFH